MKKINKELKDVLYSILFLILAVSIAIRDFSFHYIIAILLGFVLHELAHRTIARYYGFHAHYVAYYKSLLMGLFMSLFGFLFLAPGAVMVEGYIARRELGKIALAGPLINIILALTSLLLSFYIHVPKAYLSINALMAFFNMIPANPFDGRKILDWNRNAYYPMLVISFILFIL